MLEANDDKFEKMYSELFPKMVGFAGKLCRNRDDAEDIAQEAFLKAYTAFDKLEDQYRVDNWLMRIIYNTFLDDKRRKSRRVVEVCEGVFDSEKPLENFPDSTPNPDDLFMKKYVDPQILTALRRLDPISRQLFSLVYIDLKDQDEVSKQFGMNIGALRSRLHRITNKLKGEIAMRNPSTF